MVSTTTYLLVPILVFLIAVWGIFLNRKNLIVVLMSIELMLLSVNLNFIIFSVAMDDIVGQLFSIFVLTIAASESSIGLAPLVVFSRIKQGIGFSCQRNVLRG